ncbi:MULTISPECIES: cell-envelope stress modulator CpxP [Proteus]|jgi:protein CpxP|uniref:Periplasmic protein n=2 Tax=Enterobacterales TaxID=91347 RepID=A0A379F8H7_PROVU|nr:MULTISPECIES: cell-envelope stress modulator CpxP [Proteus]NBN58833.1 periplasmic heavy metal sensor [Proteus sp. G2639]RNT30995.1 periplasmic heavy metal sensor [Proteus mirabilis]AYY82559.1 periplasmic heavy metal sensor [Proteus vulgaris]KGA56934.1 LTXXQ motif family protein [Proteus vulgaris]MBG5970527.1 Spy/CpxP family protein refolding chaperone [Proteus vulgaris]
MRKVAVVALASMFLAAPTVVLAETANTNPPTEQQYNGNYHCGYGYGMHGDRDYRGHRGQRGHMMDRNYGESRMFNGITLTEQQRTQMRDLMRQHHQDRYNGNYRQRHENMHKLVTAPQFDEAAVRAQIQDMDKQAIERHVEMAKVHNQMYQLLTPEQKAQLEKNYQQRMSDFDQQGQ